MAKAPTMDEWAEKIGTIALNGFEYNGKTLREWIDLMASGYCVVLPDGVTNGDVIKALFPDIKVYGRSGYAHSSDKSSVLLEHMSSDWLNAPYKGGNGVKKDKIAKQGKWIEHKEQGEVCEESTYECPRCHNLFSYNGNFCPECGLDMRGDVE